MAGFKCFLIKVKVGEAFILFLFFLYPRDADRRTKCYVQLTKPNVIKLCSEANLGQLKSSNMAQTLSACFHSLFFLNLLSCMQN